MTTKQANWIQYWWGKEDHRIYQVIEKIKSEKKLDRVSQDMFQEIYDAFDDWDGGESTVRQIFTKLNGVR